MSLFTDKESILCEKQHGHYLSMCEQQSQGLVKKCENLKQKIQQLKSRFDNCEHLLSDNAGLCENVREELIFAFIRNFKLYILKTLNCKVFSIIDGQTIRERLQ